MLSLSKLPFSKNQIATAIAILFHVVGLIGILIFKNDFFIKATPFNLLLSFSLLFWTQQKKNNWFYLFVIATLIIGFFVEWVGVNTGYLFGNYDYGNVLGYKWQQVPIVIGINWFIIIYCCGISIQTLLLKLSGQLQTENATVKYLKAISVLTDGATLAVLFDWLMEPVAVKLGFWKWEAAVIPVYNYICWFIISMVLLLLFHRCRFNKQNIFAINLLLIQIMFFLILRTFLN